MLVACFLIVSFLKLVQPFKKSVLPATLGCLQHMSRVTTFLSPLKFSQGNSSFHFGINRRFCLSLSCFPSSGLSQLFVGSCSRCSFVCCLCGWSLGVVGGSLFFNFFFCYLGSRLYSTTQRAVQGVACSESHGDIFQSARSPVSKFDNLDMQRKWAWQ